MNLLQLINSFKKFLQLKKNYLHNFVWRAIQMGGRQVVMFSILFISAKLLPSTQFGIYNYLIAFVVLFTLLADFGMSRAISRFVAEYNITQKEKVNYILFNSGIILLILIALFTSILMIFAEDIVGKNYNLIKYLIPTFVFLPLTSLFDGFYSGLKKFKLISFVSTFSGVISIPATYLLVSKYQLIGAFLSLDLYYLLLFILLFIFHRNYVFRFNREVFLRVWKYSAIIGISSIGHFFYAKANTIILGKFNFFNEVGYLEIIDKVFIMLAFPFIIFGQIISPRITELKTENKHEMISSYFRKILYYSIPLSLIITIIMWFAFPIAIKTFLSEYYSTNFINMFKLLLINLPLLLITNSLSQPFIIATGAAKYSLLTIPFGVLNVVLAILLITQFGYIGAVYSILITSIISKLLTYYLVYKNLSRDL